MAIKNEYEPKTVSHPGFTLADLLSERGMSQAELAERTGRPKNRINEIINGKYGITPDTAIQLERALNTPASFWNNRQRIYDEFVAAQSAKHVLDDNTSWLQNFPIPQMQKLGWIEKAKEKSAQLEILLKYFGISSPKQWPAMWNNPVTAPAYRESPAFKKNPYATSAWLRKGEIEADAIQCSPFSRENFLAALHAIRKATRGSAGDIDQLIVSSCAESGVAVAFIPPLKGVTVYGATRWLNPDKAFIQCSLRGKFEDLLWFTFFHEAGHILKHGKKEVFIEGTDHHNDKECEANEFARDFLIPPQQWKTFIRRADYRNGSTIQAFAAELEISAAIVVGRLQHEKLIPNTHHNPLRRRFDFANK